MLARSVASALASAGCCRAAAITRLAISTPPWRVAARKQSSLSLKWA